MKKVCYSCWKKIDGQCSFRFCKNNIKKFMSDVEVSIDGGANYHGPARMYEMDLPIKWQFCHLHFEHGQEFHKGQMLVDEL